MSFHSKEEVGSREPEVGMKHASFALRSDWDAHRLLTLCLGPGGRLFRAFAVLGLCWTIAVDGDQPRLEGEAGRRGVEHLL
jgi:hypothetical protein